MNSVEGAICVITSYATDRGEIQYSIIHLANSHYSSEGFLQTELPLQKYIERFGLEIALEKIKAFDDKLTEKIMKQIA